MPTITLNTNQTPREYFYDMVMIDTDECILWPYFIYKNGYGRLTINKYRIGIHRLALITRVRKPLEKEYALHSCRNRHCFNVRHLRWGTHQENMADRGVEGTACRGERLHSAKLTEADVIFIRTCGLATKILSERFNITRGHVQKVRTGKKWAYMAPISK